MAYLVLVRHGQSEWNLQNRFTGWIDVKLSPQGEKEASKAAAALNGYRFDKAYTSALIRAQDTLDIILTDLNQKNISVLKDAALNERHYGDLQGLNKDDLRVKYGPEQVQLWRRSYDVRPPNGECLADTAARVVPFYKSNIAKNLAAGNNVLVAAHGNSLRAIVMYLDKLSPEQVMALEIPTGTSYVYEFDSSMKIIAKEILEQ